jgi:hypothetical protein
MMYFYAIGELPYMSMPGSNENSTNMTTTAAVADVAAPATDNCTPPSLPPFVMHSPFNQTVTGGNYSYPTFMLVPATGLTGTVTPTVRNHMHACFGCAYRGKTRRGDRKRTAQKHHCTIVICKTIETLEMRENLVQDTNKKACWHMGGFV